MRATLATLLLALALLVSACGGGDDSGSTSTSGADGDSTAAADSPCKSVDSPPAKKVKLKPPPSKAPPEGTTVTFETSCGGFTVELDTKNDPKTAASFAYLADQGFYDDTVFHRIAPGFVIQGGDPLGSSTDPTLVGTGGPGYSVTEKPPGNTSYTQGVVAMAKTSAEPPGTSGSQFYVVTGADAGLPPDYAVAGKVSAGFDTVKAIESQASSQDGPPLQTILIEKATVDEG